MARYTVDDMSSYKETIFIRAPKWHLKDEFPVDALRACVFIYLPYILKNNVEFRRK